MKTHSKVRIVVTGSSDRQIDEMMRESGAHVSSHAIDDLAAIGRSGAPQPDAVIVDLRDRQSLPPALMHLKRQHPGIGVVIVAPALDATLMLEAMRAGVSEWIPEPLTAAVLVAAVQRVTAQHVHGEPEGQLFAFVGAKGGVGTTTVAVNIATALARVAPRRSLLVDLHLSHGDTALFTGVEPRFTTADVLENIHRLDEAYLHGVISTTPAGLHVLGSSDRGVSPIAGPEPVREMIDFTAKHYEYVILDVPRSDITMLDSLDRAASVVIVANQELATVRRAGALSLALRQRYGKEHVALVINRFDRNCEIGREDVERVTGGAVRHVIPSDYRLALDGLNKGRPVVIDNHNRLSASFASLARSLAGLDVAKAANTEERQAGLFGRLGLARS